MVNIANRYINALYEYRIENPLVTWEKIAEITGMTITGLHRLSRKNSKELLNVRFGTYLILKEKLNVDLASSIKSYKP